MFPAISKKNRKQDMICEDEPVQDWIKNSNV